ncbi:MAG: hydrogenase small subunit [Kiritimatiellales bacterium]|nr:hydrogenase small subunit [Kiritimatiellales bacterium]
MNISRRRFVEYCGVVAGVLGLNPFDLGRLNSALANPDAPSVIWIHGSSCTGCSVSFLNRISDKVGEPATIVDVVAGAINLIYHPTVMVLAGEASGAILEQALQTGNYILVVEGGVATAFDGFCCIAYSYNGEEVTFQQTVTQLADKAAYVVCAGTCSSFGGIPGSGSNPTGVISTQELIGRPTINISGCPANPDWVVWAVVQLLLGNPVTLDANNRPVDLYLTDHDGAASEATIHDKPCPRNGNVEAESFADTTGEKCLIRLGCRGPSTKARCNKSWNGIAGEANWCIGVNAPCHGCTEPSFPGPESFFEPYES